MKLTLIIEGARGAGKTRLAHFIEAMIAAEYGISKRSSAEGAGVEYHEYLVIQVPEETRRA